MEFEGPSYNFLLPGCGELKQYTLLRTEDIDVVKH